MINPGHLGRKHYLTFWQLVSQMICIAKCYTVLYMAWQNKIPLIIVFLMHERVSYFGQPYVLLLQSCVLRLYAFKQREYGYLVRWRKTGIARLIQDCWKRFRRWTDEKERGRKCLNYQPRSSWTDVLLNFLTTGATNNFLSKVLHNTSYSALK